MKQRINSIENFINEGDEVSVDVALSPAHKKQLKKAFEQYALGVDKLSFRKDGTIVAKRGYFYYDGLTPDKVADKLKTTLKSAGVEIEIIKTWDEFQSWPKDNNMCVKFKIK